MKLMYYTRESIPYILIWVFGFLAGMSIAQ